VYKSSSAQRRGVFLLVSKICRACHSDRSIDRCGVEESVFPHTRRLRRHPLLRTKSRLRQYAPAAQPFTREAFRVVEGADPYRGNGFLTCVGNDRGRTAQDAGPYKNKSEGISPRFWRFTLLSIQIQELQPPKEPARCQQPY
jgi:hypothetical protein